MTMDTTTTRSSSQEDTKTDILEVHFCISETEFQRIYDSTIADLIAKKIASQELYTEKTESKNTK